MSNTSTTTTTNTNRMLLSGSSSLLNSKRRPSVGKIEELIEPMSENYSEQTGLSSVSSKYDNRMENDHKQQQQKRNTELLKAKNYLKTQLKLPEPKADETNNQASNNSNNLTQSMIATTSTKLRSNSFLMGKNNSEIGHLIASFDGTRNANGGNETINNTIQHTAPKQLSHQQQLQQQAALKSSLVASTHASLARQHYANKPNNKMSNENLKSSISRIARQKSGDQLKAMSMNEKQLNREVASIKKEEAQTGQAPQANYNPYSSSSSSSSACVYSGNNSTTPPQKSSPTSIPLAQTNIQSHQQQQQQQQQITMNLPSTAQQQQQQQQQQYQQEQLNHRKELLLIPSDKLADYITRSISKLKSEENNAVVDQMASFIDELKDFIDDRLIDTTSQLEMSNRHIYHLYKSVNYLIKEVSSLKIQNEELKQELFILNSRLKSKAHFQPQPQMSHHQQTLINHTNPICCYATLKKTGASAAMPKTNEYLLVESSHPSDEKDLSRLSELSGGDTNNDSVNGRSFYESAFTDEDPRNNLNYLNWQRQQRSKPSVASSSTGGPSSMVTTTNTATTVSGVSNTTNNISSSNPFFTVSASSEIDIDNSISLPNNNNNNNNPVIATEKFVSTDENLDNVKMNKLLNCEIDYFKNTGTVVNSKSAGVSPRRSSKTENNLKIIDQLLSSKFVDKRNNNEELESGAMSNAQSKNSDGSSNRRAREILSKSSIIHHLHASLAPFTSLINDFDAQYSWDYTDNNNI